MPLKLCICSSRCLESSSLFSWPTLTSSLKTQFKCYHLWKAETPFPSVPSSSVLCYLAVILRVHLVSVSSPLTDLERLDGRGQVYRGLQSPALERCLLQSGRGREPGSVNSAGTVKGLRSTGPEGPACGVHQEARGKLPQRLRPGVPLITPDSNWSPQLGKNSLWDPL